MKAWGAKVTIGAAPAEAELAALAAELPAALAALVIEEMAEESPEAEADERAEEALLPMLLVTEDRELEMELARDPD